MWRVRVGLNQSITLSFLLAGHTKFSPDWCFGLIKQRFRRTEVGCVQDIVNVVEQSATVNSAQLIGHENGHIIVPTYDWTGFLAPSFKRIKSIKKFHHFKISSSNPDELMMKEAEAEPTLKLNIISNSSEFLDSGQMPSQITPRGLTPERQWYLFDKIREFCPAASRDITCPLPLVHRPSTPRPSPEPVLHKDSDRSTIEELTLHKRVCGMCGKSGHNQCSCQNEK